MVSFQKCNYSFFALYEICLFFRVISKLNYFIENIFKYLAYLKYDIFQYWPDVIIKTKTR